MSRRTLQRLRNFLAAHPGFQAADVLEHWAHHRRWCNAHERWEREIRFGSGSPGRCLESRRVRG